MNNFNINPQKNYERIANGDVFTGQQILNVLDISEPEMQTVILLDIFESEKPASHPKLKYGVE